MISKVKSRCTRVNGVKFRYKVSSRPKSKGVFELNITIQSEDHNGSKLFVTGIIQHDCSVKPPRCDDDYIYFPIIIRDDIEGYIEEAIEQGWDYSRSGRGFELPSTNEPFRFIAYWEDRSVEWFQGRNFLALHSSHP